MAAFFLLKGLDMQCDRKKDESLVMEKQRHR